MQLALRKKIIKYKAYLNFALVVKWLGSGLQLRIIGNTITLVQIQSGALLIRA